MNDWQFGGFLAVAGMGITLLVLYILGWLIRLMIKLFPYKEEEEKKAGS